MRLLVRSMSKRMTWTSGRELPIGMRTRRSLRGVQLFGLSSWRGVFEAVLRPSIDLSACAPLPRYLPWSRCGHELRREGDGGGWRAHGGLARASALPSVGLSESLRVSPEVGLLASWSPAHSATFSMTHVGLSARRFERILCFLAPRGHSWDLAGLLLRPLFLESLRIVRLHRSLLKEMRGVVGGVARSG